MTFSKQDVLLRIYEINEIAILDINYGSYKNH